MTDRIKRMGKMAGCVLALLICLLLPAAGEQPVEADRSVETVPPSPAGNEADRLVSVDFNDVDLAVFIKFISELTGRNFVVDEQVKGKITIISPAKISVEEAYQVFESVLEVHGYTTVQSGSIIKVVKDMDARSKSVETGLAGIEPESAEDKVVTQIIPLKFGDPNEVKQLFVPLVSKAGIILAYPSTNMLIVTDYHSNIKRLMNILHVIDVTGIGRQVSVTPLEYSDATKLVTILESMFQSKQAKAKGADEGVRMVADDRSNSIVLLASETETRQIKQLITILDKKVPSGKESIHVVFLKNADAEEMTEVLLNLPKGGEGEKKEAGPKKTPVISKEVSITADPATNSLIIMAERDDFLVLKEIIEKLDIPRSMVYIECLIVEVNVNKDFILGVEWMAGGETHYNDRDGAYVGGFGGAGTAYSNIYGMVNDAGVATLPAGLSLGAFSEAINIGGVMFPSVAAIAQAYKRDKDVHILSTPQIMTTDNTEASITVGKNIPYLTKTGTTDASETYNNYEYNDIGIKLKIKPQINENRLIRMDISQEVTRLDQVSAVTYSDKPSTLKRTIETNVIVHDNHTIVIGGLIDDTMTRSEYRVPCLGDIPIFGYLFQSLNDATDRTNLFVFLTPHVIKDRSEADRIMQDKETEMEAVTGGEFNLFPSPDKSPAGGEKSIGDGAGASDATGDTSGMLPPESGRGEESDDHAVNDGSASAGAPSDAGTVTEENSGAGDAPEEAAAEETDEEGNVIKNIFLDRRSTASPTAFESGAETGRGRMEESGGGDAVVSNGEEPAGQGQSQESPPPAETP
ncbi:MAG: type II secretion system secretin GspD [Thermodesulfobacteriota bacterium]